MAARDCSTTPFSVLTLDVAEVVNKFITTNAHKLIQTHTKNRLHFRMRNATLKEHEGTSDSRSIRVSQQGGGGSRQAGIRFFLIVCKCHLSPDLAPYARTSKTCSAKMTYATRMLYRLSTSRCAATRVTMHRVNEQRNLLRDCLCRRIAS